MMYKIIEYVSGRYQSIKETEFVNQFVYGTYGKYPVYPLYTMNASKLSFNDKNHITFYTMVKIKRRGNLVKYVFPVEVSFTYDYLDDDIMSASIRQFHRKVNEVENNLTNKNIKDMLKNNKNKD